MDRIFHARMAAGQYAFLILITFLTLFSLWQKMPIIALCSMLLVVFQIEKLIHTTYTLTAEGTLELYYGRFSRRKTILLKEITSVERASSMKFGNFALIHYVLITYGADKYIALLPVKEEEFIQMLHNLQDRG